MIVGGEERAIRPVVRARCPPYKSLYRRAGDRQTVDRDRPGCGCTGEGGTVRFSVPGAYRR